VDATSDPVLPTSAYSGSIIHPIRVHGSEHSLPNGTELVQKQKGYIKIIAAITLSGMVLLWFGVVLAFLTSIVHREPRNKLLRNKRPTLGHDLSQ